MASQLNDEQLRKDLEKFVNAHSMESILGADIPDFIIADHMLESFYELCSSYNKLKRWNKHEGK
jgi:hypothetical protein